MVLNFRIIFRNFIQKIFDFATHLSDKKNIPQQNKSVVDFISICWPADWVHQILNQFYQSKPVLGQRKQMMSIFTFWILKYELLSNSDSDSVGDWIICERK